VAASRYELGPIIAVRALPGGHTARLDLTDGSLVLKRRPLASIDRLDAAHSVVAFLEARGLRVRRPLQTLEGVARVSIGPWVYDLRPWIEGERFDGSLERSRSAGHALGELHQHLGSLRPPFQHAALRVHERPGVVDGLLSAGPLDATAAELYRTACREVNACNPASWMQQLVHGDWHRGNVLFEVGGSGVAAVLDFDEVGLAPPLFELVSGAVQFATVTPPGNPWAWPAETDPHRLEAFIQGYRDARRTRGLWKRAWSAPRGQAQAGAWIMAQSLLAQVSDLRRGELETKRTETPSEGNPGTPSEDGSGGTTGAIETEPAAKMLGMVIRKAQWLVERKDWIADLLRG
jgi:Ser/Thr protein kinase RdoA (MazF antagonist)